MGLGEGGFTLLSSVLADLIFIIQYVRGEEEEEGNIHTAANMAGVKSFPADIFVDPAGTLGDQGPQRLRAIMEPVCLRHG